MKILLVRSGGTGDCILTLPIVQHLKNKMPESELAVLGNTAMLEVGAIAGLFAQRYSLDSGDYHTLFSQAPSDTVRNFLKGYDLILFFTAASQLIRENIANSCDLSNCHFLDPRPPSGFSGHITQYFFSILNDSSVAGSNDYSVAGALPPMPAPLIQWGNAHSRQILIHPGSGSTDKNWPLEKFIELARQLNRRVEFIMGPAEIERGMLNSIKATGFTVHSGLTMPELTTLLTGASLYIGNDSGITHLSAWLGLPTVALFGMSSSELWRPLGNDVRVIAAKDGAIDSISIQQVLDVALKAM